MIPITIAMQIMASKPNRMKSLSIFVILDFLRIRI